MIEHSAPRKVAKEVTVPARQAVCMYVVVKCGILPHIKKVACFFIKHFVLLEKLEESMANQRQTPNSLQGAKDTRAMAHQRSLR